ncbi:MAG TPA: GtrA family protein [Chthonomonadaceae bacterium]|nr:GtrA family protein [Chthonomonadaceae bacterium]
MSAIAALIYRPAMRQFIKFIIIGFTSACIDVGVNKLLIHKFDTPWMLAAVIGFALGVTNGFIWNSRWTFRGMGSGRQHELYVKFVAVNIVGLLLNLCIMKLVFIGMTGQILLSANPTAFQWNVAKAIAIVIVAVWNFGANKLWTFRHKPALSAPNNA